MIEPAKQQAHQGARAVTTGMRTDLGNIQTKQQDSLGYLNAPLDKKTGALAFHKGHLYVVADGVGGSEAGGLAGRLAVETIIEEFYQDREPDIEAGLRKAITRAHQRLLEESRKRNIIRMQTAVVCAVIRGRTLYLAHAGDSRAYLIRGREIVARTVDHSKVQRLLDEQKLTPEEARTSPDQNIITRALGNRPAFEPDIDGPIDIVPEDILLLCSDGLHKDLDDETIIRLLAANPDPQIACQALVEQAKSAGGKDNISVIVTRVGDIENFAGQTEAAFQPPGPLRIKQLRRTLLAPLDEPPETPLAWWQQKQIILLVGSALVVFIAILFIQTTWLQRVNSTLTSDLENSRQKLIEAHQTIETLRQNYGQGLYGPVNEPLLQEMENIEIQLQIEPDQLSSPDNPTPFVIPTNTTTPPITVSPDN